MFIEVFLRPDEFERLKRAISEKDALRRAFEDARGPKGRGSFVGYWLDVDKENLERFLELAKQYAPTAESALQRAIDAHILHRHLRKRRRRGPPDDLEPA